MKNHDYTDRFIGSAVLPLLGITTIVFCFWAVSNMATSLYARWTTPSVVRLIDEVRANIDTFNRTAEGWAIQEADLEISISATVEDGSEGSAGTLKATTSNAQESGHKVVFRIRRTPAGDVSPRLLPTPSPRP